MANDIIEIGLVVKDKGLKESLNTVSRLEAQIIKANKAVDQGRITQERYNKILLQAKRDYEALGVSSQKATAEVRKFAAANQYVTTSLQESGKAAKRMQLGIQQAGYQVGDFAVQVASGTNWVTAFTQQGTQLVSFFGGPWGAAIGAAGAIVGAFAVYLMKSKEAADKTAESAKDLEDRIKGLDKALRDYSNTQEALSKGMSLDQFFSTEAVKKAREDVVEAKKAVDDFNKTVLSGGYGMAGGIDVGRLLGIDVGKLLGFGEEKELKAAEEALQSAIERLAALNKKAAEERQNDAREFYYEEKKRLEDLAEANRKAVAEIKLATDSAKQEQQDRIFLAQAELNFGKDSVQLKQTQADIERRIYSEQLKSNGVLGNNLSAAMGLYDYAVKLEASLDGARKEAVALAAALKSATSFSSNLDKDVDTLRARLSELKGEAHAVLNLTAEQAKEEARLNAARSIAAGEDATVANARLAIDLAQIENRRNLTIQIEEETAATKAGGKAAKVAAKEFDKLVAEAKKIEESHDALLKFNNDFAELNKLYKTGLLSQKAYTREVEKLQKALVDSIPYVNELSDAFTKFIMSGFNNFKDFVSSIKDMFKQALAEMISMALKNQIIIPIAAGITGSTLGATAASAGGSTLGGSLLSATGVSAFSSSVGSGLAASLGTGGFTSAGLFNVGANASLATATGAGAIGATIGAVIAPLAAVAAVFSFFTKKVKELDSGLKVTVKSMDAFVQTFSTIETTRFWGLSKKVSTNYADASAEISDPVVKAVQDIQQSIVDAAATLNISGDVFDNFFYDMTISLKGLTEDQKIQKINEEMLKMGDAFAALTGHFETMNDLLTAANQRLELQNRLDTLLGNSSAVLTRQREAELAAMNELNRPLAQAIYDLEDAQAAVTNAFASLRASIDAVVNDLKDKLTVANEAVNRSRSIVNQLEQALSGRYVTSDIGATMSRRAGAINFLKAGNFQDEQALSDALSVVSEPTEGLFGSFVDYARDFYKTSAIIEEAKKTATVQLTADEQQVALLEQQIADAENQYQVMVDQYNAMLGIDTSVKSVNEAVNGVIGALANLAAAQSAAKNAANAGPSSVGTSGGSFADLFGTGEQYNGYDLAKLGGAADLLKAASLLGIGTSGKTGAQIQQEISNASQMAVSLDSATRAQQFAQGGFHQGGIRMVGENGPELEATGPSRIFSHNQTASMFRDPDLKDAVRSLKEEVAGLRSEQRQIQMDISKYTKRSYDLERKWDVDGLPATRT